MWCAIEFWSVLSLQTRVGVAEEFIDDDQSDDEAKTTRCVQCLMTFFISFVPQQHINQILNLHHQHNRPLRFPAVSLQG